MADRHEETGEEVDESDLWSMTTQQNQARKARAFHAPGRDFTPATGPMTADELTRVQRDLAVALNGESDRAAALAMCMDAAMKISGMECSGIYLVDDRRGLKLVAHTGLSDEFVETIEYHAPDSAHAQLVLAGEPRHVRPEELPPAINEHCKIEGLRLLAVMPIRHREQVVACMIVASRVLGELPTPVRNQLEAIAAGVGGTIARLRAEADLRSSERRLRALLNATTESAFMIDLKGNVLISNETLAQRLGTTAEQLIGKCIDDFLPPELAQSRRAHVNVAIRSGEPVSFVDEREGRHYRNRVYPVLDEAGSVVRLAVFSADVTERKLAERKLHAEQHLLRELLDLQERERTLISHELHDGFLQDIVAAHMVLSAACEKQELADGSDSADMEVARELIEKGITEARRMIRELRPMTIDQSGIVEAIADIVAGEQRHGTLEIDFEHEGRFDRLDEMLESAVYRIVHESINNVKRHSRADSLWIRLVQGDDLLLRIEDQGVGFDLQQVPKDRFGVRGIVERARLFGGQATIDTAPGKGTRITVRLPLVG
ncbi:MAG: PAS domain-containing protein [Thermoguttaceae bacterium]